MIPTNVLIDVESGEVCIMYLDMSEVKRIPLREEVDMLSGLEPPVGQSGRDRVSDGAASAVAPSPAGVQTSHLQLDHIQVLNGCAQRRIMRMHVLQKWSRVALGHHFQRLCR